MITKWVQPKLFWLAIIAFGINFCFAFQLANLSSIFKFLGVGNAHLPLLWLIPPLTGLIVQPIIGQMSDDTVTRFGKRKPYIIGWSFLAAAAFCCLPFAGGLGYTLFILWLIDCSLNGSSEGLRALTGDVTQSEQERSRAFALQAFLSGLGGALGTSLPYIVNQLLIYIKPHSIEITFGQIPQNLKYAFYVTSFILLVTIFCAITFVKERIYKHNTLFVKKKKPANFFLKTSKMLKDLYNSFRKMPYHFRNVCLIHSMTWIGIFILWLYFTVTLAQNIYGLPTHHHPGNNVIYTTILQRAALDTAKYFTLYQYVSVVYAVLLYFISPFSKIKLVHASSLLIGGMGMLSISFAQTQFALVLAFIAIGIMWGSMTVLPYAIAMQLLPKGKLGTYLGIFNISITAPQIVCGLLLSAVYKYLFLGHASYLLLIGGLFIIFSAYLWIRQEHLMRISTYSKKTILAKNETL